MVAKKYIQPFNFGKYKIVKIFKIERKINPFENIKRIKLYVYFDPFENK